MLFSHGGALAAPSETSLEEMAVVGWSVAATAALKPGHPLQIARMRRFQVDRFCNPIACEERSTVSNTSQERPSNKRVRLSWQLRSQRASCRSSLSAARSFESKSPSNLAGLRAMNSIPQLVARNFDLIRFSAKWLTKCSREEKTVSQTGQAFQSPTNALTHVRLPCKTRRC